MKKNHIIKLKKISTVNSKELNGSVISSSVKTKQTGLACVPSGEPPKHN